MDQRDQSRSTELRSRAVGLRWRRAPDLERNQQQPLHGEPGRLRVQSRRGWAPLLASGRGATAAQGGRGDTGAAAADGCGARRDRERVVRVNGMVRSGWTTYKGLT